MGDFADAVLQPRLAGLPAGCRRAVEFDAGVFRAVARQQLDILDRQEQLVAAGVMDFQAVVRRAGRFDVLQADEAADAVIDVHHEIAGRQARDLGDEILRALGGAPRPHQPVAENVLFADDDRVRGLEAGLQAKHGERDLGPWQAQRLRPGGDRRQIWQSVVGQHVAHALARALAPQRDDDTLAVALQRLRMPGHRLEHIGLAVGALGREIVAGAWCRYR